MCFWCMYRKTTLTNHKTDPNVRYLTWSVHLPFQSIIRTGNPLIRSGGCRTRASKTLLESSLTRWPEQPRLLKSNRPRPILPQQYRPNPEAPPRCADKCPHIYGPQLGLPNNLRRTPKHPRNVRTFARIFLGLSSGCGGGRCGFCFCFLFERPIQKINFCGKTKATP